MTQKKDRYRGWFSNQELSYIQYSILMHETDQPRSRNNTASR